MSPTCWRYVKNHFEAIMAEVETKFEESYLGENTCVALPKKISATSPSVSERVGCG
jgi:hypothetical protein